jgi:hypothetical protein
MSRAAVSVLLLVLLAVFVAATAEPPVVKYCVTDQQQEDHMHKMMSDSLDQAFKEHIGRLFEIWIKDPAEQPTRAVNGASLGVNAYVRAQRNLANWHPPRC